MEEIYKLTQCLPEKHTGKCIRRFGGIYAS